MGGIAGSVLVLGGIAGGVVIAGPIVLEGDPFGGAVPVFGEASDPEVLGGTPEGVLY